MGALWGTVFWFHCSASNRFFCLPQSNSQLMWNKEHSLGGAKTFSGITISFLRCVLILSAGIILAVSSSNGLCLLKKKIRCLWGALGMKKICSIFVLFRCRCISEHRHKNVSPDIYNGFLLLFVWHYTTLSKAQTATLWPGVLRSFSIKMDKKEWWQLGNCRARPACHYWQRISADMEAEDREKLCCTGEKKKVEYNRMCRGS